MGGEKKADVYHRAQHMDPLVEVQTQNKCEAGQRSWRTGKTSAGQQSTVLLAFAQRRRLGCTYELVVGVAVLTCFLSALRSWLYFIRVP